MQDTHPLYSVSKLDVVLERWFRPLADLATQHMGENT